MATEREKMLSGELYDSGDHDLVAERFACRILTKQYNDSAPDEEEKRNEILKKLLEKKGDKVNIEPPFRCDYGNNITIGDRTYMNFDTIILDCAKVTIGEDCLFGPGCKIITATHPMDYKIRKNFGKELAKEIKIGNDCFFGAGCIILPGVTIGNNVVVGAGSVVTKDVPSGIVVCGNPAKYLKDL